MTTREAVCVIAQREGIILDKYVDEETVHRVRTLYQQLTPTTLQPTKKQQQKIQQAVPKLRVIKIGKDIQVEDPILKQKIIDEAREMADVYPLIYVLENSIREVIDKIMTTKYGDDWWSTQAPLELRKDVSKRMEDDQKHSWHQRRGARPIDYLDLNDLPRLMNKIEKVVVPGIIPSIEWFRQLVVAAYKSRCVVCHMNPLDRDNIQAVQVRFNEWQKQISAKKDLILGQSP